MEGQEYGPVDTDALRNWKSEGRLIPANELRRVGDRHWIRAGELVEVFADEEPAQPPPLPQDFEIPKTWRQISAETFRIYRRGFVRFMLFGLLISVPMFVLQWTLPKIPLPDLTTGTYNFPSKPVPPICGIMFGVLLLLWPISAAAFQFVADDIVHGRMRSIRDLFSAALNLWGRLFGAGLVVYGSFFFWFFVPLIALVAFMESGNPLVASVMVLLIGAVMVYMNARLFINFLFWQQTTVLESSPTLIALRESKELARSVPEAPRLERPLYRGAIVASIWLFLLLVLMFGVQLPFTAVRIAGLDPEEALALIRKLAESQTPDALMVAADVATAVLNLLLRPLLAAAFVVLYYDARARSGRMTKEEVGPET